MGAATAPGETSVCCGMDGPTGAGKATSAAATQAGAVVTGGVALLASHYGLGWSDATVATVAGLARKYEISEKQTTRTVELGAAVVAQFGRTGGEQHRQADHGQIGRQRR